MDIMKHKAGYFERLHTKRSLSYWERRAQAVHTMPLADVRPMVRLAEHFRARLDTVMFAATQRLETLRPLNPHGRQGVDCPGVPVCGAASRRRLALQRCQVAAVWPPMPPCSMTAPCSR